MKTRTMKACVIGAGLGAFALQAAGDPVFYGVQSDFLNNLVEIDVGRRTVTTIGPTGVGNVQDLAQDAFGNLVAVASEGAPVQYTVAYAIDPATATATRLATFDVETWNLAFDDVAGQFLTMPNWPRDLGTLDPSTGVFTPLAGPHNIQNPSQLYAIALAPDGTLYGAHPVVRNSELMQISPRAQATLIGPMGDGSDGNLSGSPQFPFFALSVFSLAFDPASGILYTANWQNGDIYTIDTQTGAGCFLFAGGEEAMRITGLVYKGPSDVAAAACPCERDGDPAQVDVFDLLKYLSVWFAQSPCAEVDGDGAQVDVFDLLAFLDCWFSAAAGVCP